MGFRDPRVLSESLDNNIVNPPAAPPSATTSPEADQEAGNSTWTQGYVPDNATNRPAAPPVEARDSYPAVSYQDGSSDTNITRGPNEKDEAIGRGMGLLTKKGA